MYGTTDAFLWIPIYYMKSRRNTSQSIETLKPNGTEDDTLEQTTRETSKNDENRKRSSLSQGCTIMWNALNDSSNTGLFTVNSGPEENF